MKIKHLIDHKALISKDFSAMAIRAQIKKLEESPQFDGSERLVAFLHYVVNETLAGKAALLKESVIGNVVYGRNPPYDPRIDSTVRVEARRLRRKLEAYYGGAERIDEIKITLPVGAYVPQFAASSIEGLSTLPDVRASMLQQDTNEEDLGTSVAIMAFRSLSLDPADESFADGLTDELIFALSRAPGMRVTSRSIAFQYKNRTYSLPDLAAELGVAAVLQGTVRREGTMVRITIESANPRGLIVWTDRFDIPDADKMRMQESVSASLLSRMRFDGSYLRRRQMGPNPVTVDANAKIYRARQLLDQQTAAGIRQALQLFTETANAAPNYAHGHSGAADCFCDLYRLGLISHDTASIEAKASVSRALAIDPHSVEAHTARATICAWLDRDAVAAKAFFARALELGENARASRLFGVFSTVLGRYEEAESLLAEARDIEPYSVQQDIAEAVARYQSRRYALSMAVSAGPRAQPAAAEALFHRALAHMFAKDLDGARVCVAGMDSCISKPPKFNFAQAEIQAWLGAPERALLLLKTSETAPNHYSRATLAAALDDDNACFDALDATINDLEIATVWIRSDARFDNFRDLPRFAKILARSVGLSPEQLTSISVPALS